MAKLLKAKRLVWGLIVLLATAVATLSYSSGSRYVVTVQAVERAVAVQSTIDRVLFSLTDAETGQRGFILTGDAQFLEPYEAARNDVANHLAALQRFTRLDPQQTARGGQVERLSAEKLDFIEATLRLRRSGDTAAALELVRSGRGKQLMDAVREACEQMTRYEQAELAQRRREADAAKSLAGWGVTIGAALLVVLALFSFLTISRDMRVLQQTAEELAASEELFRSLTENTSDLVRLLDLKGNVTYVSPSVEPLLGYTREEFQALPIAALMHPEEVASVNMILSDVGRGLVKDGVSIHRLRSKAGTYRYFEVHWSAQRNAQDLGVILHTVGRDVTERRLAHERLTAEAEDLRSLSLRDELTNLYNRRGFLEAAAVAQAVAVRERRAAALIFVDLNGMKAINDELGHDAGDAALQDAASVLTGVLRTSDVVGRLGGDEFVAFTLDFAPGDLDSLRQRIRALADHEIERRARPYRLSMSVGAAFSQAGSQESIDQLLDRADAAMYEQKRARRAAGGISIAPSGARG